MTRTPAEPLADGEMIEKVARADLRRAGYAHALLKMRDMLIAVHDELEDEGDRVYLGSSNHAELIHDAWHLADALHWDEILEDSQPKTPLAEVNLLLQDQLKEARAALSAYNPNDRLREALFNLTIAAGELAVATDGEVRLRPKRQAVLDAMKVAEVVLTPIS